MNQRMSFAPSHIPSPRREPGEIAVGDEVYLNHYGELAPLRRLALLALDVSIGSAGPFIVHELSNGQAMIHRAADNAPFNISTSSLTRERPLSPSHNQPFLSLSVPNFRGVIKP
jgi:hypothetical protein